MRALVVYESMYGNTHVIATNIGDGLRAVYDVTVVPVARVTKELLDSADLLVVGAPTHMHGMPNASTRKMAAKAASKPGSGLTLDPDASGPGLRDWLHGIGHGQALAAAFDTRLRGASLTTGRASRTISRWLRRRGYILAADPESFLVDQGGTLLNGERMRARCWGEALGASAAHLHRLYHPAHV